MLWESRIGHAELVKHFFSSAEVPFTASKAKQEQLEKNFLIDVFFFVPEHKGEIAD